MTFGLARRASCKADFLYTVIIYCVFKTCIQYLSNIVVTIYWLKYSESKITYHCQHLLANLKEK